MALVLIWEHFSDFWGLFFSDFWGSYCRASRIEQDQERISGNLRLLAKFATWVKIGNRKILFPVKLAPPKVFQVLYQKANISKSLTNHLRCFKFLAFWEIAFTDFRLAHHISKLVHSWKLIHKKGKKFKSGLECWCSKEHMINDFMITWRKQELD